MDQWNLCDDSKKYGEHVLFSGSEEEVKDACRKAEANGQIEVGNAYVEDPDGVQYGWNTHDQEWERL